MNSSLAKQLAQNASLNTTLLVDRSRRKPVESYLFSGRDASAHDLESVYDLGWTALQQLQTLDSRFEDYEDALFSDSARVVDRTLLTKEANGKLNEDISGLLQILGPFLMDPPAGKALEWLVRRFRINEFNVQETLKLFLPYHESPHFTKMITILHIQPNSSWSFLLPYKAAAKPLTRNALVAEMQANTDVARFVTSLLPNSIKSVSMHRTLLAFNAASLHDFISNTDNFDAGTLAHLLPALLEPLQNKSEHVTREAILGSYILFATLSQKVQLSSDALRVVLVSMTNSARRASTRQYLNAVLVLCQSQEKLDSIPDGCVRTFLKLSDLAEELSSAASYQGMEKFLAPFLQGLVNRLPEISATSVLECVLRKSQFSSPLVAELVHLLAQSYITNEPQDTSDESKLSVRYLLAQVYQRRPSSVSSIVDDIVESTPASKEQAEQLMLELAVPTSSKASSEPNSANANAIVASSDAEARVRAAGVRSLFEQLKASNDTTSIGTALLARIQDTSLLVLEALYTTEPSSLATVVSQNIPAYVSILDRIFGESKLPKRPSMKLHLSFLISHVYPLLGDPAHLWHSVLLPLLLYSKPRQHSADLIWEMVSESDLKSYELIAGFSPLAAKEGQDSIEQMASANEAIVSHVAGRIVVSRASDAHIESFLGSLSSPNRQQRALAFMVVMQLLKAFPVGQNIDVAEKALKALNHDDFQSVDKDLDRYMKVFVLKPSSRTTHSHLVLALLTAVASISKPDGLVCNWFSSEIPEDEGSAQYVHLFKSVYNLAVSTSSFAILEHLFASVKEDSLSLLMGVWLGSLPSKADNVSIATSALQHSHALFTAFTGKADGVDFQTVLPSLIIALESGHLDLPARTAAADSIRLLHTLTESKTFDRIYAFDVIYGSNKGTLQYLVQDDLRKYLSALIEHLEHFLNDPSFVRAFHHGYLTKTKQDKRKMGEFKTRILGYLLSHCGSHASPEAQLSLLQIVSDVPDATKAKALQPLIGDLCARKGSTSYDRILALELLRAFDSSTAKLLNDEDQEGLWKSFLQLLHVSRTLDNSESTLLWDNGLLAALSLERKATACEAILDIGANNADQQNFAKRNLSQVLNDVPLAVHLLSGLQPGVPNGPPANKRARLASEPEDKYPRFGFLIEVLASVELPGSLELLTRLLQTLGSVVQLDEATDIDVVFIEQSLMTAIENTARSISQIPNVTPNTVRIDVLVELIRGSSNAQISHQALSLIADLARLAPESVLADVMPIFTFMGSNVFHRDDAYSFKVVEQTIDSIVPVMTASLKSQANGKLELYKSSRDFLRVFADAAARIPRHRQTGFFTHLVDTLGPEDFLAPICMLLVQKTSPRAVKRTAQDVQASLSLPISVVQHYDHALQITVLRESLEEVSRLLRQMQEPESDPVAFLDDALYEDASAPGLALKRRAQALVAFVGFAAQRPLGPSPQESMGAVLALLINVIATRSDADIVKTANSSFLRVLGVMSAEEFVKAVSEMLKSDNVQVQLGALDVFKDRLSLMSDESRKESTGILNAIVSSIQGLLKTNKTVELSSACLRALQAIGSTMCPGEEAVLSNIIPLILDQLRTQGLITAALQALAVLPRKLGPRMLQHFRDMISRTLNVMSDHKREDVVSGGVEVIKTLLAAIPTFWSQNDVGQVVRACFDLGEGGKFKNAGSSLVKTIAKRVPAKIVLPTLADMWPTIHQSQQPHKLAVYFDLMKRTMLVAPRPSVQDHLRPLFQVFIGAFEVLSDGKAKENIEVESAIISSFVELASKLNDNTFKPFFRRLYDWAFVGDSAGQAEKQVVFCRVFGGLLDYFGTLIVPYMSFLVPSFRAILKELSSTGSISDLPLWSGVVSTIGTSLKMDEGAFWRTDSLRQMSEALIPQVPFVCGGLENNADAKALLQSTFESLVDCASDDTVLKSTNLGLLMHTRSDDPRVRLFALQCATIVWTAHGGKMLGYASETSTFVAECVEDDNDSVVKEAFKLKEAVESVAGTIS